MFTYIIANWKTTLFGALGAVGVFLASNPETAVIGKAVSMISITLLGIFSRDANKSSESSGVK